MEKNNYKELLFRKRVIFPLFLGILSLFLSNYTSKNTVWTESFFSLFLYSKIKLIIGFFPSMLNFSLFEVIIIISTIGTTLFLLYLIKKTKVTNLKMVLCNIFINLISISCIIFFIFTFTCGLNYYRYSFTHYSNYSSEVTHPDEIEDLLLALTDRLNNTQPSFENKDFSYYASESIKAMEDLSKEYPVFSQIKYSKPKPLLSSPLFSKLGIAGIFFPFTFESNINTDIPNYLMSATMTHELAHQAGFMREDEAHFISYLACITSTNNSLKYSGYFLAFYQTLTLFEKENKEKTQNIINKLSDNVKQDLNRYEKYLLTNQGTLQKIANSANNLYLKSNKQANGINDYHRMVNLVLSHYKKEKTNM